MTDAKRPRRAADAIKLIPEEDFENAMRAALSAPRDRVNQRLANMQASNKAIRERRKRESVDGN